MNKFEIVAPKEVQLKEEQIVRNQGEIKLKISKVSLSRSDLSIYNGNAFKYPMVPGRMAIGYVSETDPENSDYKFGDRVAINPFIEVKSSNIDFEGSKNAKIMGITTQGLLQDFVSLPADNVFQLPDGIKDEEALFLEYISFGCNVFEQYDFKKGDTVAIIGSGVFQLILAQLAIYYQVVPVLIDENQDTLENSKNYGIYYTINAKEENVKERMIEITGGRMAEFSIFLSKDTGFDKAVDIITDGGSIIVAGFVPDSKLHSADLSNILSKQVKIFGVNNGLDEFATSINLLANKSIKLDGIIDKAIDFAEAEEVFKDWSEDENKYKKVVVKID